MRKIVVHARIDADIFEALSKLAIKEDRSRSQVIATMLRKAVTRQPRKRSAAITRAA